MAPLSYRQRGAGRLNALFMARYAENMAKVFSRIKNKPYTAEDFARERFRLNVNAESEEINANAAQLLQQDKVVEFLNEKDRKKYELEGEAFIQSLQDPNKKNLALLKVTEAPEILVKLGYSNKDIVIPKGLALNTMKPEIQRGNRNHQHGLTLDMLKQLPKALYEPVFIFESATRGNDSIVVFTDIKDKNSRSIIVPVVFSKKSSKENTISTIYGRNAEYNFAIKQILEKRALYVSTKKGPVWAKTARVQFPRTLLKRSLSLELSIAQEKVIVNTFEQSAYHGSPHVFDNESIRIVERLEQSAMSKRNAPKTLEEFDKAVREAENPSKIGFWFTTSKGAEITISGSSYKHVQQGNHPLTLKQWQAILDDFENVEYARKDNVKGVNSGIPVQMKVDTTLGKAGISTEFLPNGKVYIDTVVFNNDAAIDNWAKNKKSSQTLGIEPNGKQDRILGTLSLIHIIQDKLGIVKNKLINQLFASQQTTA